MKKHTTTILFILIFFVGLSIFLYPSISDYINSKNQTRAIAGYTQQISEIPQIDYDAYFDVANAYNEALPSKQNRLRMTDEDREEYMSLLNPLDNNIMGYLQIDSIGVQLPIYHGTGEAELQVAVGHLEGTSLPVGGKGTHTALSGHRGLPSAKLLTELDQVERGDVFFITVLDETLAYQVDQVLIVEPHDVSALEIEPDKDYCTLITCTPYGVNSHRMLVRGTRIDYEAVEDAPQVVVRADARMIDSIKLVPFIAVPILLVTFFFMLRRKGSGKDK